MQWSELKGLYGPVEKLLGGMAWLIVVGNKNCIWETPDLLILCSVAEIAGTLQISEEESRQILDHLSACMLKMEEHGSLMINSRDCVKLSTGDKELDDWLEGGLSSSGSIVEISGESGTGKSQFALQLCLSVQKPIEFGGLNGRMNYLTQ